MSDETNLIELCERLNTRIANCALSLSDKWAQQASESGSKRMRYLDHRRRQHVVYHIGPSLTDSIDHHRCIPVSDELVDVVETALRACAVKYATKCISAFCYGAEESNAMQKVFMDLLKSGLLCNLWTPGNIVLIFPQRVIHPLHCVGEPGDTASCVNPTHGILKTSKRALRTDYRWSSATPERSPIRFSYRTKSLERLRYDASLRL